MNAIAVVTGSGGLVGSAAVEHLCQTHSRVIGIDNDTRSELFGVEASTRWRTDELLNRHPNFEHLGVDIRDRSTVEKRFRELGDQISAVVHCAAQPSHDWAATNPHTDFEINALGTLHLLEAVRSFAPSAVFVFLSTNKVYGDAPNELPLVEGAQRWLLDESHPYAATGIPESMRIDASTHSLFGVSKAAADLMVQEYGRYFGLNTTCLRGGCLTGPSHSGTQLHGFLSYLMKCAVTNTPYTIFGYKGKQVRDNIHVDDLISAIDLIVRRPGQGTVYNMGGGVFANCSMLEAIELCQEISGNEMVVSYSDSARTGDHIWYISDTSAFRRDYPEWEQEYTIERTLREIHDEGRERWLSDPA